MADVNKKTGWPDQRLVLIAIGVVAIVAVNLVLASLLSRMVKEGLLAREGTVMQEFLNGVVAAEQSADKLFTSPGPSSALLSFSSHVRSLPGTMRANIYSPDGFIRQSTDANLIGLHFDSNPELAESFTGKIASQLETVSGSGKSEHLALNVLEGEQVIEAYIPVIGPAKKVVAVVEFYRKDTGVGQMVSSIQRSFWIAAGLSSAILALLLLIAARSPERRFQKAA
jgi:hypothetical protein